MTSHAMRSAFLVALVGATIAFPAAAQLLPLGVPQLAVPGDVVTQLGVAAAGPGDGALVLYLRFEAATGTHLYAQRFSSQGGPLGDETLIGDDNDIDDGAVAYDGQGHFAVAWSDNRTIRFRRLSLDGLGDGPVLTLTPSVAGEYRFSPQVSCQNVGSSPGDPPGPPPASGDCAVSWQEQASRQRVLLQRFSPAGTPAGERIEVATLGYGDSLLAHATVAVAPDGRIAVLWIRSRFVGSGLSGSGLSGSMPFARFFGAQGQPLTAAFAIDPEATDPGLSERVSGAWNDQGQLLAVWETRRDSVQPLPSGPLQSRLLEVAEAPESPIRTLDLQGRWPALGWCGALGHFVAVSSHVPLADGGPADGGPTKDGLPPPYPPTLPATVEARLLDATGAPVGDAVPAGDPGLLGSEAGLACDSTGQVWTSWVQNQVSDTTRLLRLLRLTAGEPFCQGPILPPVPSIPCAALGADERLVAYAAFRDPAGASTYADVVDSTRDTAFFTFYGQSNPQLAFATELAVKTVDGTRLNDHLWLFYGALTDREYSLSVYDRVTGLSRTYYNRLHNLASVGDTQAFPIAPPASAGDERALASAGVQEGEPAGAGSPAPGLATRDLGCPGDTRILCLPDAGVLVSVHWRDFQGHEGDGTAFPLFGQGGRFWFFGPENVELIVKVLDGRGVNGHHWLFYASLTNVEFTLSVFDMFNNLLKEYHNPPRHFASVADTSAF